MGGFFTLGLDENPHVRAVSAAEAVLSAYSDRFGPGMFIRKLGHLVVTFEIYHIEMEGAPYIDFSENTSQPEVVRDALEVMLERHPHRRAYVDSRPTWKFWRPRFDEPFEFAGMDVVNQMLDDYGDHSGDDLRKKLGESEPHVWWN